MRRQEILADAVRYSRESFKRYLRGFDENNRTTQAANLPNHAAWTLGHLALTLHRAAEKLNGAAPSESDFVKGDGRGGDRRRFDTESVCFGSKPSDEPAIYPSLDRCVQIFDSAIEHFAQTVVNSDDATLDRAFRWGQIELTGHSLAIRMAVHVGIHAGELADLRRALKLGSIFA